MTEAFLLFIDEEADHFALTVAMNKLNEWYLSDGWYSDGPEFALDYYNSYVMHPMFVEILEICQAKGFPTPISPKLAIQRMQRFNIFIERLISPEGTYPAFGRSVVYRLGAFQSLSLAAWKYGLPKVLCNGQVRSALTCVMNNMFSIEGNFDDKGFLKLGFVGHQPELANYYTNNGSLYMTSLVFMPLALPANHPFWSEPAADWTSRKHGVANLSLLTDITLYVINNKNIISKNTMRKHLLLSILLVWSVSIYAQQAKYVFYFIGDGMGINQVQGTEIYRAELKKKRESPLYYLPNFPTLLLQPPIQRATV